MSSVGKSLAAVRRRAVAIAVARAAVGAVAAGAVALLVVALAVGPVASAERAVIAWTVVAAACGAAFAWLARPVTTWRGGGAARLLGGALASRARSALELAADPLAMARAPALVLAHARRVEADLAALPARAVVPARTLFDRRFAAAVVVVVAALSLLGASGRAVSGAWAIAHPARRDASGTPLAAAVAHVRVRVIPPGYASEPPVDHVDAAAMTVMRGSTLEVHVSPRLASRGGTVTLGGETARLDREPGGGLVGRLVARAGGPLAIALDTGSGRVRDGTSRVMTIAPDRAPRASVVSPEEDRIVEPGEEVEVAWAAKDDHGLASVDLVLRAPDGHETRRRLFDTAAGRTRLETSGNAIVSPRALGAEPGDTVVVRIEARDRDTVSGPNTGRSAPRALTVASDGDRRERSVERLRALRDATVDTLAARLEWTVPDAAVEASRRHIALAPPERGLLQSMISASDDLRVRRERRDARLVSGMAAQLAPLLDRERGLAEPRPSPRARRDESDHALVAALEADVLLLDDIVGRERIEDAQAIVHELVETRRRLETLLAELRTAPTAEAREALLAELARAEQRLEELSRRLADMGTDVPTDFANREALSPADAQHDVAAMREALAAGDLDAASMRLDALGRRLEQLASGLGQAGDDLGDARFGERDRALAEALDTLADLESEERALAERTGDVSRRAAERAEASGGSGPNARAADLARRARELREVARRIDGRHLSENESDRLDGVRQRLADTADSLASGDVAEASNMATRAANDANALAEDLQIEAEMFAGENGRTAQMARAARDVAHRAGELARNVEAAAPDGVPVPPEDRRGMQVDVPRQRRVRDAADGVAGRLARGPDGTPLSADGEQAVRDAMHEMQGAEGALGRGDAREAWRREDEAARRLHDLREQLEQDHGQSGGGGGGSGAEGDGDASGDEGAMGELLHEPVRIPGADESRGPEARRRHVLDAMRDGAPAGWEGAVRRYYEEVLR